MQKIWCYCAVFALLYFEFEGNFRVQVPGGLYLEGQFIGGFFTLRIWGGSLYLEGLIYGGAYFRNITVTLRYSKHILSFH